MSVRAKPVLLLACLSALGAVNLFCPPAAAQPSPEVVRVGGGGYKNGLPANVKAPPRTVYATENLRPPYPTNDWWSSVLWTPLSDAQYPHPLAVKAEPAGLRVFYPGPHIHANKDGIFGAMPGGKADLVLGHSELESFADARAEAFSDWFVSVRFGQASQGFTVTYGHGSPYVYAMFRQGRPIVAFAQAPQVWSGDERSAVLGVRVGKSVYGLFGPAGCAWTGLGTAKLTCRSDKPHVSLAVLPDDKPATLERFARCAHAHVTGSKVAWAYDPSAGKVAATFRFELTPREGKQQETLFALYPHQWRRLAEGGAGAELTGQAYASVRGAMKLARGGAFRTVTLLPSVLPVLPRSAALAAKDIQPLLDPLLKDDLAPMRDTYAEGKALGRLAVAAATAEQYELADEAARLRRRIRERLEEWLSAWPRGNARPGRLFAYDKVWGTLVGVPASFGSDAELNDHHFHYGYFLQAAVEAARGERGWLDDSKWGGMIRLLIRDIASGDRDDTLLPFLRCFDPYAGHSWASGHAKFGDGNNQESSSEAMNAWAAILMLGELAGDRELRDLGAWLYATEMAAVHEYWFDVHGENFPPGSPEYLAMIWGGKGVYATWFSARPEHVLGINLLPVGGASLYLGLPPASAQRQWEGLTRRTGGKLTDWADIFWMYRSLSDPADADRLLSAAGGADGPWKAEAGNSRLNTVHWIRAMGELGRLEPTVRADAPLHAVFARGSTRTYVAWALGAEGRTVTFSDGTKLDVPPGRWAVLKK